MLIRLKQVDASQTQVFPACTVRSFPNVILKMFTILNLFNLLYFSCCIPACIGCTSWLKCCDRDVFGNCVKCPGWKACCWHGKSPICKAKNHACRIIKQIAAENLQKIAVKYYIVTKEITGVEESVFFTCNTDSR